MNPALASLIQACLLRDRLDTENDADICNTLGERILSASAKLPDLVMQMFIVRTASADVIGTYLAEARERDVCLRPIRPDGSCAGEALGVWKLVTNSGRVVDQKGCE